MNILNRAQSILVSLVVFVMISGNAIAQTESQEPITKEQENAEDAASSDEADLAKSVSTNKNDKSGTNPINFQRDLRIYNEYLWLNTAGDGNQNLTTLEFRTPFAGGKWQFRARIPALQLSDRRRQRRRHGRH